MKFARVCPSSNVGAPENVFRIGPRTAGVFSTRANFCLEIVLSHDIISWMIATMESLPITTSEVAKILGVSEERVRQLCQSGCFGRKFGSQWLITEEEVEKFKPLHKRTPGPSKNSQKTA